MYVYIYIYTFYIYINSEIFMYENTYICDYVYVLIYKCYLSTYNYIHTFISISVVKKQIYIYIHKLYHL